jgi:hypothetical protein
MNIVPLTHSLLAVCRSVQKGGVHVKVSADESAPEFLAPPSASDEESEFVILA